MGWSPYSAAMADGLTSVQRGRVLLVTFVVVGLLIAWGYVRGGDEPPADTLTPAQAMCEDLGAGVSPDLLLAQSGGVYTAGEFAQVLRSNVTSACAGRLDEAKVQRFLEANG
jgi:hypothetical protein